MESHGTISSPGSGHNYPPNRDCIWQLSTDYNQRLHIIFYSLQIENSTGCSKDYLAVCIHLILKIDS